MGSQARLRRTLWDFPQGPCPSSGARRGPAGFCWRGLSLGHGLPPVCHVSRALGGGRVKGDHLLLRGEWTVRGEKGLPNGVCHAEF